MKCVSSELLRACFIPSLREKIADFERGMKNGKPWGDMEANGRLGPVDQSTGEKGFKEKS